LKKRIGKGINNANLWDRKIQEAVEEARIKNGSNCGELEKMLGIGKRLTKKSRYIEVIR
jgi:hypothetical protein